MPGVNIAANGLKKAEKERVKPCGAGWRCTWVEQGQDEREFGEEEIVRKSDSLPADMELII